jgi:hypothetical protein
MRAAAAEGVDSATAFRVERSTRYHLLSDKYSNDLPSSLQTGRTVPNFTALVICPLTRCHWS